MGRRRRRCLLAAQCAGSKPGLPMQHGDIKPAAPLAACIRTLLRAAGEVGYHCIGHPVPLLRHKPL